MPTKNSLRIISSISCYLGCIITNHYAQGGSVSKKIALATNFSNMAYPQADVAGPKPLSTWLTTYQAAKEKGLIPNSKPSISSNGEPIYPSQSYDNLSSQQKICSWTIAKCVMPDDIVVAPKGMMGISFDDGPQPPTSLLLPFLLENKQKATHFMIGSRILDNPNLLKQAVEVNGDHIAVHTWSHPLMTTMTDEQVVGEIGWTIQIIRDHVALVPAFWRPPYGDVDNRVRAIARHVFNLTTVIWSDDVNDWCLSDESKSGSDCGPGSGPQNSKDLLTELNNIVNQTKGPQERDTGIIILEHELAKRPVDAFIKTYPISRQAGWDMRTIPDLFGLQWYQNVPNPVPLVMTSPTNSSNVTADNPKSANSSLPSPLPTHISQSSRKTSFLTSCFALASSIFIFSIHASFQLYS